MGNEASHVGKRPDYTVSVKTGDRMGAGTDANVYLALHNDLGQRSREFHLDCKMRNDFEMGSFDSFPIYDLPGFGRVRNVEVWRDSAGLADDWYVDVVEVVHEATKEKSVFPVNRWIKEGLKVILKEFDSCLPQDDNHPEQRLYEMFKKKQLYELACKAEGLIPQIKNFPKDESFSNDYKWDIIKNKAHLMLQTKVTKLSSDCWKNLDDIASLYKGILPKPYGLMNWRSDKEFGYQRLTGCNSVLIRLCTKIPAKFPVTDDSVGPMLEGMTLNQALAKKKLFILDYEILRDLPCTNSRSICAPMCLFFVNRNKNLMPLAIQLFQDPGRDNPIFYPTDEKYVWLVAKMWFNNADASFHQSATHLGYTHLVIESVAVATHRSLSPSHPLFRLLAPHFLYLIAINTRALAKLVSPGGWVDECMGIGRIGMFEIIRRTWARWSLDKEGSLLNDLKDRGVDDPEVLPNYHYRDDALLVRKAIHDYVTAIVNHHYSTSEKVTSDFELQGWGRALAPGCVVHGNKHEHCGVKGLPNNGEFRTASEVADVVTDFIFISSVGHAASNFCQYDEYGFPPNYPSFLFGEPPTDKTPLTEKDILALLPPKDMTLSIMLVTKLLSDRGTNPIGDFEVQYIFDPAGMNAVAKFRSDLKKIGEIIDARNETREEKYPYLHPKEVPNAISI